MKSPALKLPVLILGSLVACIIAFTGCSDGPIDPPPPGSQDKEIVAFGFRAAKNPGLTADVSAEIMGNSISARVPFGTDVTGLVATFDSTGTRVAADGRSQVSAN
jgi:hypothetical protein